VSENLTNGADHLSHEKLLDDTRMEIEEPLKVENNPEGGSEGKKLEKLEIFNDSEQRTEMEVQMEQHQEEMDKSKDQEKMDQEGEKPKKNRRIAK